MKKIDASAHIGDSGIALIHMLVNKMGFAWHERNLDAGIDGEIELRNPATGEVANRIILVQSKASERPFPGENERGFHYLCKDADVDYWMGAEVPVLLICSHPNTGEAWWMHVQSWFADPAHRASGRIDFDKNTQRFDATAAPRLLNLADPHGRAHTTVAAFKTETLTSNLLTIGVPDLIYRTPTHLRDTRDVYQRQRATGGDMRYDFMLRDGHLYTWLPPQATALTDAVDGVTDALNTQDLADSTDPSQRRMLVQLLNHALRHDISADCDWHRGRKIVYFRATDDLQPRRIRSASGRARLVFNPKPKKNNPDEISYCQHAALEWQFLHTDDQWHCALVPTYHYTRDGHRDSYFLSSLLSGIKRLEHNKAVYLQTRMWATYLHGEDDVLDPRETVLTYGHLATFDADRSIDDTAWLADPRTPGPDARDAEDGDDTSGSDADELTLFEVEA